MMDASEGSAGSGASWRRHGAALLAGAGVLMLAACASSGGGASKFDVDAFLRAPDSALPEVVGNPAFLAATRVSATDCAVMLQSASTGVLEDLPPSSNARGPAWLLHPKDQPGQVWLVVSESGGERTCHGPLPADAMKSLASRARG
ncbi:hypothetical protein [Cupriavidus neocaledonicus]|uniref:Uncharacterized protein n=1 Tax=Cupriavidus neocaledonicus TaxID=1040979 RepID=A0A375H1N7_9BURK|nr:hypothetical protein [Cupriavidus neocaledonicus]SOZ37232.1 conserved hypothetical protein [Cupriavidus neocaledonicus]SPD45811.1 conserved protein of unknown function [Cupriavidus neocaledonicus]